MTDELNQATGLAREDAPSLSDLALPDESQGAWPRGWYRAKCLPGYATGKGTQFETASTRSKDGASLNLVICFAVKGDSYVPTSADPAQRKLTKGPGADRNLFYRMNYRPDHVSAEVVANVKEAIKHYGSINKLPNKELQSIALSLGRIGQFEKALGFKLPFTNGAYQPSVAVGHDFDIRLDIDEKGFNTIEAVAQSGAHVK